MRKPDWRAPLVPPAAIVGAPHRDVMIVDQPALVDALAAVAAPALVGGLAARLSGPVDRRALEGSLEHSLQGIHRLQLLVPRSRLGPSASPQQEASNGQEHSQSCRLQS